MISNVIQVAKEMNKKIGICGQAPSDYPEFVKFLIANGINSISLSPDVILKVTKEVVELEKEDLRLTSLVYSRIKDYSDIHSVKH